MTISRHHVCLLWLLVLGIAAGGCRPQAPQPSITFTRIPPVDAGGPDYVDVIEGRVTGAKPGQQVVLFARSAVWWLQPDQTRRFTSIRPDSTWTNSTHLGTEYAAMLVDQGYEPPPIIEALPQEGGAVIRVARVPGNADAPSPRRTLAFSGYDWTVRAAPSDRGGHNEYDPANAWTDRAGALHLRIAGAPGKWTCAELALTRSLGYGSYAFVIDDVSDLDPAAVMTLFTWDGPAVEQNHRELDIEISRWGEPKGNNARYVVQPYYLAPNVIRFAAPRGMLTHQIRWESGRATFRTFRGSKAGAARPIAEHAFTSGVPPPGNERVRVNLYAFHRGPQPLHKGSEVVIKEFTYVP